MTDSFLVRFELYFVIGAVLYLIYTKIEKYFPTMADVSSKFTYAAIFLAWPVMVLVLLEEYVRNIRDKEKGHE